MTIRTHLCTYSLHREVEMCGRWNCRKYVRLPLTHGPVFPHIPLPLRRAPARGCHKQRRQWKRRRFVQSLRRARG